MESGRRLGLISAILAPLAAIATIMALLFGEGLLVSKNTSTTPASSALVPTSSATSTTEPPEDGSESTLNDALTGPSPSPSDEQEPSGSAHSSDVPEDFVGTWSGTQTEQYGGQSIRHRVRMHISNGLVGQQVGVSELSTLGCTFALVLRDSTTDTIDLDARLTGGTNCINAGYRVSSDGSDLSYDVYVAGAIVGYGSVSRT